MHLASKKLILRLDGSCPSRPEAQWLTDAAEPRLSQLMPRSGASWRWAIQCQPIVAILEFASPFWRNRLLFLKAERHYSNV